MCSPTAAVAAVGLVVQHQAMANRPRSPTPPPIAPEAPRLPDVTRATAQMAQRRRAGGGTGGNILTGPSGVSVPGTTQTKTLLGQ